MGRQINIAVSDEAHLKLSATAKRMNLPINEYIRVVLGNANPPKTKIKVWKSGKTLLEVEAVIYRTVTEYATFYSGTFFTDQSGFEKLCGLDFKQLSINPARYQLGVRTDDDLEGAVQITTITVTGDRYIVSFSNLTDFAKVEWHRG